MVGSAARIPPTRLIPLTLKFPRQQRFVIAAAIQQGTRTFQLRLFEAQPAVSGKRAVELRIGWK